MKNENNSNEKKGVKLDFSLEKFGREFEDIKARYSIRFLFVFLTALIFAATAILIVGIVLILGLFPVFKGSVFTSATPIVISAIIAFTIVGTTIAAITSKFFLSRLRKIQDGMMEISKGNFKVRLKEHDKKGKVTEFGVLETTFNKMASDLDGIELFRNDFINDFSHEFKTPIVSIKGFAHQLQNPNVTEEQRAEYVAIIAAESDRLAKMSTNILLLTKLENQRIVSEKTTFELDEQIRKTAILLYDKWNEKNIELDLDELDPIEYTFNEEMLSHVWINLISNAVKFTPNDGKISISLHRQNNAVICSVKDNGIGMSEETVERIFEKFYQGDSSHHASGNGIGLNIVKRVVTLAGGKINVESSLGSGSIFTVILPVTQA